MKQHGVQLLGCSSTWFLLDIAFCSQKLFQKDIFSSLGWLPAGREDERRGGGVEGLSCPSADGVGFDCAGVVGDGGGGGRDRAVGDANDGFVVDDIVHVDCDVPVVRCAWEPSCAAGITRRL